MPNDHFPPAAPADWGLPEIVRQLRGSREDTHHIRHRGEIRQLPSADALVTILNGLSAVLFPTHYGQADLRDESIDYFVGHTLNRTLDALLEQVRRGLLFDPAPLAADAEAPDLRHKAAEICVEFARQLPHIRNLLVSDLHAAYQGDPAATSVSEILMCYPGMKAVIYYRLAHALYQLDCSFLARMISRLAHASTGIDIHPGAHIGASFFIDHGTGVVVGETAIIGERVRLYQAVTLGAKNFPADEHGALVKGIARHPIVEDDVVIYAGATVLGRITIGKGSSIGGNVWLTQSVPPGSEVSQARMRNQPC